MAITDIVVARGTIYGTTPRDLAITPTAADSKVVVVAWCGGEDTWTITRDPASANEAPDFSITPGYNATAGITLAVGIWDGQPASAETFRIAHTDTGGGDPKIHIFAFAGAATGTAEANDEDAVASSAGTTVTPTITVSENAYIVALTGSPTGSPNLSSMAVVTEVAAEATSGDAEVNRYGHTPTPGDTTAGSKSIACVWDTAWGGKYGFAMSFAEAGAGAGGLVTAQLAQRGGLAARGGLAGRHRGVAG